MRNWVGAILHAAIFRLSNVTVVIERAMLQHASTSMQRRAAEFFAGIGLVRLAAERAKWQTGCPHNLTCVSMREEGIAMSRSLARTAAPTRKC